MNKVRSKIKPPKSLLCSGVKLFLVDGQDGDKILIFEKDHSAATKRYISWALKSNYIEKKDVTFERENAFAEEIVVDEKTRMILFEPKQHIDVEAF